MAGMHLETGFCIHHTSEALLAVFSEPPNKQYFQLWHDVRLCRSFRGSRFCGAVVMLISETFF